MVDDSISVHFSESNKPKMKTQDTSNLVNLIHTSPDIRPDSLVLSDVKWKYLVRSFFVVRTS